MHSFSCFSRIDYLPVERECDDLPGDELAGSLQRFFRSHFESAAAWNLHAHDGDGLDVVLAQDFRELLRVVNGIELGAYYTKSTLSKINGQQLSQLFAESI